MDKQTKLLRFWLAVSLLFAGINFFLVMFVTFHIVNGIAMLLGFATYIVLVTKNSEIAIGTKSQKSADTKGVEKNKR